MSTERMTEDELVRDYTVIQDALIPAGAAGLSARALVNQCVDRIDRALLLDHIIDLVRLGVLWACQGPTMETTFIGIDLEGVNALRRPR